MARFGRGQPHAPIFLRAPLVAAIVAAATVSPLHVITAERPAAYGKRTTITYVRPPRSSFVPDRPLSQFHIITTAAARGNVRPNGLTLYVRNPQAPVASLDRLAPQVHVVSLTPQRVAIRPDSAVIYLRPSRAALVPDRLAPQIHVVSQLRRRTEYTPLIILLRNPQAPVVPASIAPQIHIVSSTVWRRAVRPDGSVVYLRPSRTSFVPDRLAPQIHVVSRVGDRVRVRREPVLLYQHGSLAAPIVELALRVTDLGVYRYLVDDAGGSVLGLVDDPTVRYVAWDASGNLYLVWDGSAHRLNAEDV